MTTETIAPHRTKRLRTAKNTPLAKAYQSTRDVARPDWLLQHPVVTQIRPLRPDAPVHPPLTGPYRTGRLAAITTDPVTVTVARIPLPGADADLASALDDLVTTLDETEGTLGAGVFAPGEVGGPYHVVARFTSAESLRQWEHSDTRAQVLAPIDSLTDEVAVATAPTNDAFFSAIDATSTAHPARLILHNVLWSLPISVLLVFTTSPLLASTPLLIRLIAGGLISGTLAAIFTQPVREALRRARSRRAPLR